MGQAAEQEVETFLAAGGGFRPSSPTYPHPHDKPFDPTKTYKDPNAPPLPVSHDPHGALRASSCSVYGSNPEGGGGGGAQDSSEDEEENRSPPDGPGKRAIVVKTQPADD